MSSEIRRPVLLRPGNSKLDFQAIAIIMKIENDWLRRQSPD
ncbi:hypothetical protein D1AOALGA4SA_12460 [Olavius algarvensis Delta 1 endosymbiont]|nr:hypothetical protein D1AOALGA4SA_12460 [Olavius algarvensis Delta 1 endosymbiont]